VSQSITPPAAFWKVVASEAERLTVAALKVAMKPRPCTMTAVVEIVTASRKIPTPFARLAEVVRVAAETVRSRAVERASVAVRLVEVLNALATALRTVAEVARVAASACVEARLMVAVEAIAALSALPAPRLIVAEEAMLAATGLPVRRKRAAVVAMEVAERAFPVPRLNVAAVAMVTAARVANLFTAPAMVAAEVTVAERARPAFFETLAVVVMDAALGVRLESSGASLIGRSEIAEMPNIIRPNNCRRCSRWGLG
jgi:hypothetical protein